MLPVRAPLRRAQRDRSVPVPHPAPELHPLCKSIENCIPSLYLLLHQRSTDVLPFTFLIKHHQIRIITILVEHKAVLIAAGERKEVSPRVFCGDAQALPDERFYRPCLPRPDRRRTRNTSSRLPFLRENPGSNPITMVSPGASGAVHVSAARGACQVAVKIADHYAGKV